MTTRLPKEDLNSSSLLGKFLMKKLSNIKNGYIVVNGLINLEFGQVSSPLSCSITVHNKKFFELALSQGVLGIAEAYLCGYWDVDDLVMLIRIFSKNRHFV